MPYTPPAPIEVQILDKPVGKSKAMHVVPEADLKPVNEEVKDTAEFLSQFTKRVKKQLVAPDRGKTVNAQNKPQAVSQKVAGMQQPPSPDGMMKPGGQNGEAQFKNIVIGQSSLAEFIPGIREGSFTALNTDQFTYYTFFNRINEQVRYRWIANMRNYMSRLTQQDLAALSKIDRHTVFEIILDREGKFVDSVLQNSSGDRHLDQAATDAFRDAAPFPNPPHGMIEQDGLIHLRYHFVVYFNPPGYGPAG
jgi:protein TonB